jgi:hypothetical protein
MQKLGREKVHLQPTLRYEAASNSPAKRSAETLSISCLPVAADTLLSAHDGAGAGAGDRRQPTATLGTGCSSTLGVSRRVPRSRVPNGRRTSQSNESVLS